jgi:hypothetical protein
MILNRPHTSLINLSFFLEARYVLSEVGANSLNILKMNFALKRVKYHRISFQEH